MQTPGCGVNGRGVGHDLPAPTVAAPNAEGLHMPLAVTLMLGIGGLVALVKGADWFVDGAATAAARRGWSPALVGALILGLGTSAPEIVVSARAATAGNPGLAIGNVLGSNVANLTLVLGIASTIAITTATRRVLRTELVLATGGTIAFVAAIQGGITRTEGVLLAGGLTVAIVMMVRGAGTSPADVTPDGAGPRVWQTVAGMAGVLVGAELVVRAAVAVAGTLGLSDGFVGMTMVAVGTSLPELATAVTSARRQQVEMLAGNLLGSNVFNTLAVGAIAGTFAPGPVHDPTLTVVGVAIVLAATAAVAGLLVARRQVGRPAGFVLVGLWVVSLPMLA